MSVCIKPQSLAWVFASNPNPPNQLLVEHSQPHKTSSHKPCNPWICCQSWYICIEAVWLSVLYSATTQYFSVAGSDQVRKRKKEPGTKQLKNIIGGGWSAGAEFRAVFYFIFLFSFAFCVRCWGPRFEFCVFVAGWRHALRSEWPFIIIIYYCFCMTQETVRRLPFRCYTRKGSDLDQSQQTNKIKLLK